MAIEAHKNEAPTEQAPHAEREDDRRHERHERTEHAKKEESAGSARRASTKKVKNNVRKLRMERMMSKAELARRAGLSTLTVDRVERGMSCRMDTKRKILEALGLKPQDRVMVFGDAEED